MKTDEQKDREGDALDAAQDAVRRLWEREDAGEEISEEEREMVANALDAAEAPFREGVER